MGIVTEDCTAAQSLLSDPLIFGAVFELHFAEVHSYLARRVGLERADELSAEVFALAFARRATFDPLRGTPRAWLFGFATNLVHSNRRHEQRMLELDARMAAARPPAAASIEHVATAELSPWVALALARLATDQRDVLLLFAWADLSYEEISNALSIPIGTVRSRLARARATLREVLDGSLNPDSGGQEKNR